MPYRYLGASGARVSAIALGTMNFSLSSSSAHLEVLDAFLAAGGNFIDTADVYSGGESEKAVGEWIKARGLATGTARSRIFLATKVSAPCFRKNAKLANSCFIHYGSNALLLGGALWWWADWSE